MVNWGRLRVEHQAFNPAIPGNVDPQDLFQVLLRSRTDTRRLQGRSPWSGPVRSDPDTPQH